MKQWLFWTIKWFRYIFHIAISMSGESKKRIVFNSRKKEFNFDWKRIENSDNYHFWQVCKIGVGLDWPRIIEAPSSLKMQSAAMLAFVTTWKLNKMLKKENRINYAQEYCEFEQLISTLRSNRCDGESDSPHILAWLLYKCLETREKDCHQELGISIWLRLKADRKLRKLRPLATLRNQI